MGVLEHLLGMDSRAQKVYSGPPRDPLLAEIFGQPESSTGIKVTAETAMRHSAVIACVKVLSETIASLPLILYERDGESKRRATGLRLYRVLHDQPNRWQTAFEFREMQQAHVLLRGNSYAEIVRDGSGQVAELIPLHPDRVRPFWAPNGQRAYEWTPLDGPGQVLLQDEVHHVAGLGFDGLMGLDPIRYEQEAIALGIAAEAYGGRFFSNDARPGVALMHPATLGEEAHRRLRESWERRHRGVDKSHTPAVLEEGMKIETIGVDPAAAQFLELRQFQVAEVARLYRVPLFLIQETEKSTSWGTGLEQMSRGFVSFTLSPWFSRNEQAISRDLIPPTRRDVLFAEFLAEALMRGDVEKRYKAYAIGRNWGWLSPNDVRRRENMDPLTPDVGDQYLQPVNMVPLGMEDGGAPTQQNARTVRPGEPTLPEPAGGAGLRGVLAAAVERITRKELNTLRGIAQKAEEPGDMYARVRAFYAETLPEYMRDVLGDDYTAAARHRKRNLTRFEWAGPEGIAEAVEALEAAPGTVELTEAILQEVGHGEG